LSKTTDADPVGGALHNQQKDQGKTGPGLLECEHHQLDKGGWEGTSGGVSKVALKGLGLSHDHR